MIQAHGGNIDQLLEELQITPREIVDFSANINPLGMPTEFKQAILEQMDSVERYPDYSYKLLRKRLATHYQISENCLSVTNGAEEAIRTVMTLLPETIIMLQPTFSEYEKAAISRNKTVIHLDLSEVQNFRVQLDDLLQWIDALDLKVSGQSYFKAALFLCNPNNPTGVIYTKSEIEALAEALAQRQIVLIMDESFMDFVSQRESYSVMNSEKKMPNVILIQSLTKFYAIPGLRLGMIVFPDESFKLKFDRILGTWTVNTFAMICGQLVGQLGAYSLETREYYLQEQAKLVEFLRKQPGIKVYQPAVNFIFFYTTINNLLIKLLHKGIAIRSCENFKALESGYYRIAVRTSEENQRLIERMTEVIAEEFVDGKMG